MRIVFFGTPAFAAEVLEFLIDNEVDVAAVITKPDRPKGRSGSPVPGDVKLVVEKRLAGIPFYQPERVSTPEYCEILTNLHIDLFVVVAYGEIISQKLLDIPPKGCINVHASLLPKYRGAAPIQRCIMNGEKTTGITIMYMEKRMDAGNIIRTDEVPIGEYMTAGELELALRKTGSRALLAVIRDLERGGVASTVQDHSQATLAPKVELEECEIHWDSSAQQIHNLIRGATPVPGAWCYAVYRGEKRRLKVTRTSVVGLSATPGKILSYGNEGIVVACGQDAISIGQLQLEGKRMLEAKDFIRGISFDQFSFS